MSTRDVNRPQWKPTLGEMVLMSSEGVTYVAQFVLCIFCYNHLGLRWSLYLGWGLLALATVLAWRSRVDLQTKGGSSEGESWMRTRTVVATGVYGLVRHPMYLSFLWMSFSLILLSQHWLNAVLGAIFMGLLYNDMRREEQSNLAVFRDDYQRYMDRVPRVNLLAGLIRHVHKGN